MSVEFQFQYQNQVELAQDMARRLTDLLAENKALEAENKRLREALDFLSDGNCFEGLNGLEKDIYEYQYDVHRERQSDDGEDPNSEERIEGLVRMIESHKALKGGE